MRKINLLLKRKAMEPPQKSQRLDTPASCSSASACDKCELQLTLSDKIKPLISEFWEIVPE